MHDCDKCDKDRNCAVGLTGDDFFDTIVGGGPITCGKSYSVCRHLSKEIRYCATNNGRTQMKSTPYCSKFSKFLGNELKILPECSGIENIHSKYWKLAIEVV